MKPQVHLGMEILSLHMPDKQIAGTQDQVEALRPMSHSDTLLSPKQSNRGSDVVAIINQTVHVCCSFLDAIQRIIAQTHNELKLL